MQWFLNLGAVWQALIASLMMYLMTALGASFVFFSKKINKTVITALTGGAAGIMIAASFFSLLLPAIEYESSVPAYITAPVGFLLGGACVVLCDVLLSHRAFSPKVVGVAFAAAGAEGAVLSAFFLAVGIAIQNFPEGMCVAFPLRAKGMSPLKSFLFSQGSGFIEIPSCIIGAVAATFVSGLLPWALTFSAGAMIAVVCSELVPECFSGNKTVATLGIVMGFCLMTVLDLALG